MNDWELAGKIVAAIILLAVIIALALAAYGG